MTFELLVLRFMSMVLRAQWLGGFSRDEMKALLSDMEQRIINHSPPGRSPDGEEEEKPGLPILAEF